MDARLAEFETLAMDARDLGEKFAAADQMRRELQRQQAQQAPPPVTGDPTMTAPPPAPPRQPPPPELRMLQQQAQNITQELMQAKILRAAMSERQLEEVLVDFWFNHFNVFIGKGQVRQYLTDYEQNVIRPHVLGSFRDLLGATAHSPAMLFYLDNFQSSSPNAAVMISPEMERRLNDPRLRPEQRRKSCAARDAPAGAAAAARAQRELRARADGAPHARRRGRLHAEGRLEVRPRAHGLDDRPRRGWAALPVPVANARAGDKVILGANFPKGGGQEEGERVLDMLPSTRRRRGTFPSSSRSASLPTSRRRRSAIAQRRGSSTRRANLREVTRVIITSPEFRGRGVPRQGEDPLEFVVSAIRGSGATIVNAQPLVPKMQQSDAALRLPAANRLLG